MGPFCQGDVGEACRCGGWSGCQCEQVLECLTTLLLGLQQGNKMQLLFLVEGKQCLVLVLLQGSQGMDEVLEW